LNLKHFSYHIGEENHNEDFIFQSLENSETLRHFSVSLNNFGHIPRILYSAASLKIFNNIEILEFTGKCKIPSLFAEVRKIDQIISSLPTNGYFKARIMFIFNLIDGFLFNAEDIFLVLTFWLRISFKAMRFIKLRLVFEKITKTHIAVVTNAVHKVLLNAEFAELAGLSHEIVNNRTILANASAKVDLSICGDADKNLVTAFYPYGK
jgi:hypothetical protein